MGCNGAAVVSFFREIIVSSRRPLIPTVRRRRYIYEHIKIHPSLYRFTINAQIHCFNVFRIACSRIRSVLAHHLR
jgi:hypothetical protein